MAFEGSGEPKLLSHSYEEYDDDDIPLSSRLFRLSNLGTSSSNFDDGSVKKRPIKRPFLCTSVMKSKLKVSSYEDEDDDGDEDEDGIPLSQRLKKPATSVHKSLPKITKSTSTLEGQKKKQVEEQGQKKRDMDESARELKQKKNHLACVRRVNRRHEKTKRKIEECVKDVVAKETQLSLMDGMVREQELELKIEEIELHLGVDVIDKDRERKEEELEALFQKIAECTKKLDCIRRNDQVHKKKLSEIEECVKNLVITLFSLMEEIFREHRLWLKPKEGELHQVKEDIDKRKKEEFEAVIREIAECNKELKTQEEEVDVTKKLIDGEAKELDSERKKLHKIMSTRADQHDQMKDFDLTKEQFMELESKEKHYERRVKELKSKKKRVKRRVKKLESKEKHLKSGVKEFELKEKEFESQVKEIELKKKHFESQVKEIELKKKHFESQVKELESKEKQFERRVKELESKEKEFEGQLNECEPKKKHLESRVKDLESQENELEGRMKEFELKKEDFEDQMKELKAKEKQLEGQVKDFESKKEEFEGQVKELESQENELEGRMEEFELKEEDFEDQMKELKSKEKQLEGQVKDFESKKEEFEGQVKELALKEKQFEERGKELESKDIKFEVQSEEIMSKEKQEQFNELEFKEKQFEVQLKELKSKEKQFKAQVKDLELTRDEFDERLKELDLIEKQYEVLIKSFEEEKELDNQLRPTIDGRSFQLLPIEKTDDESSDNEILAGLKATSDPSKVVLDIIHNPIVPHFKDGDDAVIMDSSHIFMLEQLLIISPHIKPDVREEAMKLALDLKANIRTSTENSLEVLGFLLLLSIYGLIPFFDEEEVLKLFEFAAQYKQAVELFQTLGFADKISDFVQNLVNKQQYIEAVRFICAYKLVGKNQPLDLLREYVQNAKLVSEISCMNTNSLEIKDKARDQEIATLTNVLHCISDNNLEPEDLLDEIEDRILELKKQNVGK